MKHSIIPAAPTYSFSTTIERGRNEREHQVDVRYMAHIGGIEIVGTALHGDGYDLTGRELDELHRQAIGDWTELCADDELGCVQSHAQVAM